MNEKDRTTIKKDIVNNMKTVTQYEVSTMLLVRKQVFQVVVEYGWVICDVSMKCATFIFRVITRNPDDGLFRNVGKQLPNHMMQ